LTDLRPLFLVLHYLERYPRAAGNVAAHILVKVLLRSLEEYGTGWSLLKYVHH
jgi:hypothetical protein